MRTPDPVAGDLAARPVRADARARAGSPYWLLLPRGRGRAARPVAAASGRRACSTCPDRRGFAAELVAAGHEVVLVRERRGRRARRRARPGPRPAGARRQPVAGLARPSGSVDLVLAESRALSMCLAAEVTAEQLAARAATRRPAAARRRLARPGPGPAGRPGPLGRARRRAVRRRRPGARTTTARSPAASGRRSSPRCSPTPGSRSSGCGRARCSSPATVERALEQGGRAALRTLVETEVALAAGAAGRGDRAAPGRQRPPPG